MTILSLILALALEQLRPISSRNPLYLAFIRFANRLERGLNAGEVRSGVYAWGLAVLPVLAVVVTSYCLLSRANPFFGLVFTVLILYLTMGFRQFSHAFTAVSKALQADDLPVARAMLADWTGQHTSEMTPDEISRLAIEQGLIDSYRYVFAPVFWFAVLAWLVGPAGALLYRAASLLASKWGGRNDPFGRCAETVLAWLDYLPVRMTAAGFAVMGDFEDAVYCWRSQARAWIDQAQGILLASGAGAIGIRLGDALHMDHTVKFRPELGLGDPVSPDYLASAVGLIWRSILLWLVLVLGLTVAMWVA
ncbi:CobD/CbiB family protein [Jeongeupia naejangsanensis]|uniref:Cobalamin biosynthesis protein CobD n=1 Tax=Jeongeupia naejangsanensis TaxID=613195 RepID=A0ABS2BQA2_9NEIS|nr:CobD/CbiB family protein [Jeongeupia naejangsanensis]MBM3117806.1 CobD/CbiB family protein [Jeongeupia naejangsanensis]